MVYLAKGENLRHPVFKPPHLTLPESEAAVLPYPHHFGRCGLGASEAWFLGAVQAYDLDGMREVAVKVHQLSQGWTEAKKASYVKHATREFNIHRWVVFSLLSLNHGFECSCQPPSLVPAQSGLGIHQKNRRRKKDVLCLLN